MFSSTAHVANGTSGGNTDLEADSRLFGGDAIILHTDEAQGGWRWDRKKNCITHITHYTLSLSPTLPFLSTAQGGQEIIVVSSPRSVSVCVSVFDQEAMNRHWKEQRIWNRERQRE